MATPKNIKSSRSASKKAKPSARAATKKSLPKATAKGKTISKPSAVSKSKTSVKKAAGKKQASISKKVTPGKPKSAPKTLVLAKGKAKAKPSATKSKAPVKATKAVKPTIKPVKKPLITALKGKKPESPIVAGKAPKSTGITKASAPKVAGKLAPTKPALSAGSSKPSTHHSIAGSKVTDKAGKQSTGSHVLSSKQSQPAKSKESTLKTSKPIASPTAKPFYKMTEKKEHRPIVATATTEEPHKTRYSDKELEEFDQLIDQKLIVAREQLEFYLKQLEDMAENPDNKIKGLDDGLSTLESERVSSMAARQQKLIQHLENAKIRIKNKVYGICRETGKLISKERLRAVPHATLSIEAKQAQN